jgi:hypothetical protein
MTLWQRSMAALIITTACITMPFLVATHDGRAQDKEGKEVGEKAPKGIAAKNTAGQVMSPTGAFNVKKAELTWLKEETRGGNASITVVFDSKPAAPSVTFKYNDQTVTLTHVKDSVYSGLLSVNTSSLTDKADDGAMKAPPEKRPLDRLHFDGRHVIGVPKNVDYSKPLQFKRGAPLDLLGSPACFKDTDIARSLMITDPAVVNDPTRTYNPITDSGNGKGEWSFGHIMTVLANTSETKITPEAFTRRWLARWEHDQVSNDFTVEKRPNIKNLVIDPWPTITMPDGTKDLDLAKAPFRLLAIVNRVDLRDSFLFEIPPAALVRDGKGLLGEPKRMRQPQVPRDSPGGEARMIFGVVDRSQLPPVKPVNMKFTVIFEFGVYLDQCDQIKAWGTQWYNLKKNAINSPEYRENLTLITEKFIKPAQDPAKPKQDFALNQVRTNEIALASPWELREFRVPHEHSEKGHLRLVTVGQTPNNAPAKSAEDLNNTAQVADFVNANVATLLTNTHTVPLQFPSGKAFLGGRSLTINKDFFWNAKGIANNDARHHFSLNTCNGCHGKETNTPAFVMVSPTEAEANGAAKLAPFLTGLAGSTFPDPVDPMVLRTFNDLGRRKKDLDRLVCLPCFYQIFHRPIRMTH